MNGRVECACALAEKREIVAEQVHRVWDEELG
jgi:hypothetical protein